MAPKLLLAVAAGSIAVVLCGIGIWIAVAAASDPWSRPGSTWSRGSLAGDKIRLLSNGRFVFEPWCDVCLGNPRTLGSWTRNGAFLELKPDSPIKSLGSQTLSVARYRGCDALVEGAPPSNARELNPLSTFLPEGQSCVGP